MAKHVEGEGHAEHPDVEVMERLGVEFLDPAKELSDGLRGIAQRMRDMAPELSSRHYRYFFKENAKVLSKAAFCDRVEQEGTIDPPAWSVLHCLDCAGGARFAPASARALYEIERTGNPIVNEVLAKKKALLGKQGKVNAVAWVECVEEQLSGLRAAA